jgi:hypothetical protein
MILLPEKIGAKEIDFVFAFCSINIAVKLGFSNFNFRRFSGLVSEIRVYLGCRELEGKKREKNNLN